MTTQLFAYDTGQSGGLSNKLLVGDALNVTIYTEETVQIIYPPRAKMSNTKLKEFQRIPIKQISHPSKITPTGTELCNVIYLSDSIGDKCHNSTSRANILLWFNAKPELQNKIAVLDFQTTTITQMELLWLRGTPLTASLVPNLCIAVRFQLESGFEYDMCLCDSHDGLFTRVSMNKMGKDKLQPNDAILVDKIIALREAGKVDDILISTSSTGTKNVRALIEQKGADNPAELHLTTISERELKKLVWTEAKQMFGKRGYDKTKVDAQIAACLESLASITNVEKSWDPSLCWVRPNFFARDFLRGKNYNVDYFDGRWELKDLTAAEFRKVLGVVQKHERYLIFGENQSPQYKLIHKDADLPGGYSKCSTKKRRLARLIYVLDMNGEVIISCEKFILGNRYSRLAHSQLAWGYPVKAAGELILEQYERNATKQWFFVEINNRSGHYTPPASSIFDDVLSELKIKLSQFFADGLYVRKINTLAIGMPGRS